MSSVSENLLMIRPRVALASLNDLKIRANEIGENAHRVSTATQTFYNVIFLDKHLHSSIGIFENSNWVWWWVGSMKAATFISDK